MKDRLRHIFISFCVLTWRERKVSIQLSSMELVPDVENAEISDSFATHPKAKTGERSSAVGWPCFFTARVDCNNAVIITELDLVFMPQCS